MLHDYIVRYLFVFMILSLILVEIVGSILVIDV